MSCSYADVTVPRATPSWAARSRLDGRRVPGASRPSRTARRSSDSTARLPFAVGRRSSR
ncbi:hypothetical protein F4560_007415 [Saccharothrix ecbatanensis]|uniref:Uncharacterized protein n=1 Tax=Saccharothrix ecbatanensis TaxID=1105145 RepID=A0A7W9HSE8_9PSEU|nr:hypothetical protein [Saccharothrix ecbatanensis]MBB5807647.1 hypothetical protein [Saccharothrix ecbatanensis]